MKEVFYKTHWLEFDGAKISACGNVTSTAIKYSSSPTAEEVNCKSCLKKFDRIMKQKKNEGRS
jgi:signal transduction histidine kinase